MKGFTDKGLTQQLAAKLEREARERKTGLVNVEAERLAQHKQSPIEEHLKAFESSISGKENTAKHVRLVMSRVRRTVEACGFNSISEIRRRRRSLGDTEWQRGAGTRTASANNNPCRGYVA